MSKRLYTLTDRMPINSAEAIRGASHGRESQLHTYSPLILSTPLVTIGFKPADAGEGSFFILSVDGLDLRHARCYRHTKA